jgi:hypothetical protein
MIAALVSIATTMITNSGGVQSRLRKRMDCRSFLLFSCVATGVLGGQATQMRTVALLRLCFGASMRSCSPTYVQGVKSFSCLVRVDAGRSRLNRDPGSYFKCDPPSQGRAGRVRTPFRTDAPQVRTFSPSGPWSNPRSSRSSAHVKIGAQPAVELGEGISLPGSGHGR